MTSRLSLLKIAERLSLARSSFPIGSHILHQKSGGVYEVIAISAREHDSEPLITFRSTMFDNGSAVLTRLGNIPIERHLVMFTRPISELNEEVDVDGVKKQRFVRVHRREIWETSTGMVVQR